MLVLVFLFTKTSLDVFHGNASLLEKESFPGCYRVRRTNRERARGGEKSEATELSDITNGSDVSERPTR